MTRRDSLRRVLDGGVLGALLGVLALGISSPSSSSSSAPVVEAEPSRAEVLVERFECWSGDAPEEHADEIPSGAVVALPGERARLVSSSVGFEIWQEGRAGRLFAFCAGDEVEEALR